MKKTALLCAIFMFVFAVNVHGGGKGCGSKKPCKKPAKPSAQEVASKQTIKLSYEVKDGDLHLSWSPATSEPSGGVKIAFSESNNNPLYGHDPYVKWMPGTGHSSAVISNCRAASSKPRHYRICSVTKKNHREFVALSNVITVPAVEKKKGGSCDKSLGKSSCKTKKSKCDTAKSKCGKSADKCSGDCDNCKSKSTCKTEACSSKKAGEYFCPECGARYNDGTKFCKKDGTALKPVK